MKATDDNTTTAGETEPDIAGQLPRATQLRLDLICQLTDCIDAEFERAVDEMLEFGLSVRDIGRALRDRCRPVRALTVTNAEIAEHGLDRHPDVVALRWDDHGWFATLTCRECVEAHRHEYRAQPPDEDNGLVYEGMAMFCDLCEQPVGPHGKSSVG